MRNALLALVGSFLACFAAPSATDAGARVGNDHRLGPRGMVWVPAGEFTMGWDGPEGRLDERPAHRVRVDGFWIDETEITNAQFRAFAGAAGHVTTAERRVDWKKLTVC